MGRLDGRVAIVTGGAQGIGATYAKGLAAEGAAVTVSDILDTAKSVKAIEAAGGKAIGVAADVSDTASVSEMVAATTSAFGKVDILVNNAALFASLDLKPFSAIEDDEWDRVMEVNIGGLFRCARATNRSQQHIDSSIAVASQELGE